MWTKSGTLPTSASHRRVHQTLRTDRLATFPAGEKSLGLRMDSTAQRIRCRPRASAMFDIGRQRGHLRGGVSVSQAEDSGNGAWSGFLSGGGVREVQ